ncbi:hypothetical protein EMO89_01665 [Bifidobacterium tissieri]|uniref:Head-to-tail stopper n=1 Tax=Bifidobacterium tissieri TaxID=1630162 RepID=A0A5M9ZVC1_9BIFI|nr:hypothetical protein [Bifidobacterium tissieri]KAA8831468.1 hypothetical protein EMO89_01665 [Bifidobacterium tissieri]
MSLPSWCSQTVAIRRAPLVSERGSRIPDWTHATSHPVSGCSVQPASATMTEDAQRVDGRSIRYVLYLPPTADIEDTDHVILPDGEYVIVDGMLRWEDILSGGLDHLQCRLARWEG